jgi:hypothetical protein
MSVGERPMEKESRLYVDAITPRFVPKMISDENCDIHEPFRKPPWIAVDTWKGAVACILRVPPV